MRLTISVSFRASPGNAPSTARVCRKQPARRSWCLPARFAYRLGPDLAYSGWARVLAPHLERLGNNAVHVSQRSSRTEGDRICWNSLQSILYADPSPRQQVNARASPGNHKAGGLPDRADFTRGLPSRAPARASTMFSAVSGAWRRKTPVSPATTTSPSRPIRRPVRRSVSPGPSNPSRER